MGDDMDADLACAIAGNPSEHRSDRIAAADALADWLESGGYVPSALADELRADGVSERNLRHEAILWARSIA